LNKENTVVCIEEIDLIPDVFRRHSEKRDTLESLRIHRSKDEVPNKDSSILCDGEQWDSRDN
jgi:ribosomal protein L30/L7E